MKKLLSMLLIVLTFSCNTNDNVETVNKSNTDNIALSDLETLSAIDFNPDDYGPMMWLPQDVKVIKDENYEYVRFESEKYCYLGYDTDGKLIPYDFSKESNPGGGSAVTVSCICTEGDKDACKVVALNDNSIVCVIQKDCDVCQKSESVSSTSKVETFITTGGWVNLSEGISLAKANEELPYSFPAMFEYKELYSQLEQFMLKYYDNLSDIPEPVYDMNNDVYKLPEGYKYVVLNTFGRASVVILPEDTKSSGAEGTELYCPCNGNGKCKVYNKLVIKYCDKDDKNPCSEPCNVMVQEGGNERSAHIFKTYVK